MSSKAQVERERADLKTRLRKINMLAGTPCRASIITYDDCRELLRTIEQLSSFERTVSEGE
jgi:hypothetical protein